MKNLFTRLALVAVAFVSMTQVASADHNTYSEGTWAVAARAGIAPATFSKDANFTTTFADTSGILPLTPTSAVTVSRSYNQLYNVPFTASADVGYFVCDNWEAFVSFAFDHTCGDNFTYTQNFRAPIAMKWSVRDQSGYAGYVGSRWYFCGWDCLIPFIGAKIGVKGHSSCSGSETVNADATAAGGIAILAHRSTKKDCASFAGGLQLGFDWVFCDAYALTFMSEMVGVAGRKFDSALQNHTNAAAAALGFSYTSQVTKNPRGYLSFPITLGVRVRL